MNVTECIKSRRNNFKYKSKSFVHSIIASAVIDVSDFPSGQPHIIRYIAIEFSSIPGTIAKEFTPYYNFKTNRSVPVLIADIFIRGAWV